MKNRISSKILIAVLFVSLIFTFALGMVNFYHESRRLNTDLLNNTKATTERLSYFLAKPLWNYHDEEIFRIIDYECQHESIVAVLLYNDMGAIVAGQISTAGSPVTVKGELTEQQQSLLRQSFAEQSENIYFDTTKIGNVTVYVDDAPVREQLKQILFLFSAEIIFIFLGISVTLFFVLRKSIVKPLLQLENSVSSISLDNLSVPIPVSGDDEISSLAKRFKQMTKELQLSIEQQQKMNQQLTQAQKLEAIGMLVSGISHDYNNILGAIIGSAEMLGRLAKKEELEQRDKFERHLKTIKDSGHRASDLIRQLLIMSMEQEIDLTNVDLCEVVQHVAKLLRSSQDKSIRLQLELPDKAAMVIADAIQLEQVLLNLCINACHAMTIMRPEGNAWGGDLTISLQRISSLQLQEEAVLIDTKTSWRLSVKDSGIGMDKELLQHIFTPFYTTKDQGVGSGLGLSMVFNIIKQLNGHISVESEPGRGSSFDIFLPAITTEALPSSTPQTLEDIPLPKLSGLVLLAEDEPGLRENGAQILSECGCDVLVAADGAEAITIAQQHGPDIDLIILDMVMPIMSGRDAFPQIKAAASNAKILLTSGYSNDPRVLELQTKKMIDGFVCKPYSVSELVFSTHTILSDSAEKKGEATCG